MNDNKNITLEQLRNKLEELQNDDFKFILYEKNGYFHYDKSLDELTNNAFDEFVLSEMSDLQVNSKGQLMFKSHGFNYTLFASKTVLGKF